jgi:hypothetical protein
MLRGSRLNPTLSAWHQLFGSYDYNKAPMAPPGIRVLVHEKPLNRNTWDPHATDDKISCSRLIVMAYVAVVR